LRLVIKMPSKLFVANIGWNTTDDAFAKVFASYDGVTEPIVMRNRATSASRGFGFVTCESKEVADKIISSQLKLDGRALEFKPAVSREEMAKPNGQPETKKLFVAGVSYDTTDESFQEYFSQFGEIESALIMRNRATKVSRGFGFVTFVESQGVQACLPPVQLELDGRRLDVKPAVPKESIDQRGPIRGYGGPGSGMRGMGMGMGMQQHYGSRGRSMAPKAQRPRKSKKIFVAGLTPNTTDADLDAHFRQYGTIIDSVVKKDANGTSREFGFVFFATTESVAAAVAVSDHVINNKNVDIKVAIPKHQMQGEGRGRGSSSYNAQPAYGGVEPAYNSYQGGGYPAASSGGYSAQSSGYANQAQSSYGNQSGAYPAQPYPHQDPISPYAQQPSYGAYSAQATGFPQQGAYPQQGYSAYGDTDNASTYKNSARGDRSYHPYR